MELPNKDASALKQFLDRIEAHIQHDKDHEVLFKSNLQSVESSLLSIVENDHGLLNYLLDLYNQLCVPYRERLAFLSNLITCSQAAT